MRSLALSTSALFVLLIHLINQAQFFKKTSLLFLSPVIAVSSALCPTTIILPSASIYASL